MSILIKNAQPGILKTCLVLIVLLVGLNGANPSYAQVSWDTLTKEQKESILKKLPPEEQRFIRNELDRTTGESKKDQPKEAGKTTDIKNLKTQDIDALKNAPEFRHLKPEDIEALTNAKDLKNLSPEALEALKTSPEFKNLKPEDIVKGKELLEKKGRPLLEKAQDKDKRPDDRQDTTAASEKEKILEEEKPSLFQRTRQIGKYQDISLDIKPFGHDFFQEAAIRVVTERQDVPAPAKYVVGPGDEVKIMLWGRVNAQYNLTVDRNGSINIPQLGPIYVAGMTFEQMSTHLIKQSNQIVGANIDISMGALKTIPIFVLGDVKRPGAYTIGAFSTITDALLRAGGPSEIGSMRNIQLKRKDQIVSIFDCYNLLLKGDKSSDRILMAGDVIFVPVSGPLVGVAGNVRRPAIYELKEKTDLPSLLELAGGIIPAAYTQQIQIERIVKNEKQIIVDIDDKDLNQSASVHLKDSDLVKIFSIVEADVNAIQLNGHVKRPGKYEMKPGMRLKDILKNVEDLLPEPYLKYALIKRSYPPSREPILIPFHLGNMLSGASEAADMELKPRDEIYVFSAWFFKDKPTFTVRGEVREPDTYDLIGNSRVKDAILAAGGLTKEAYQERGQILRLDENGQYSLAYFSVSGALQENEADNILLKSDDVITIRALSEMFYKQSVSVGGAVTDPGEFEYAAGMTVKDLIFSAGNVLESAYLEAAELSSMEIKNAEVAGIQTRNIDLRRALSGDAEHNILLRPYDRIFVRHITDWRLARYVTISGQVKFSGKYLIQKGEKLSSVIERAGGYLDNAYLRGSVFIRERVKETQQKSMEEMARRMERDLLVEGIGKVSTSLSVEEVQAKQNEIAQKKKLIEEIRNIKALGRMTVKLAHLKALKNSQYDIELEDGDELMIPEKNSVVTVLGAVMGQGSHIFSEKADYRDYINMSGGYSDYADGGNVFILKVDGSARRAKRGLIDWSRKQDVQGIGFFSEEETFYIEPGDTIVVPEKIGRIAWLREIRDITQILMNTAVVAGVLIALF